MVIAGHDSGPAEPLDRISDSPVVRGDDDPADERGLFDTSVDVLDQGLSIDLDEWFSGETSGIEPGGNDRDGGIKLHQTPQLILARRYRTTQVPFGRKLASRIAEGGGETES